MVSKFVSPLKVMSFFDEMPNWEVPMHSIDISLFKKEKQHPKDKKGVTKLSKANLKWLSQAASEDIHQ